MQIKKEVQSLLLRVCILFQSFVVLFGKTLDG